MIMDSFITRLLTLQEKTGQSLFELSHSKRRGDVGVNLPPIKSLGLLPPLL